MGMTIAETVEMDGLRRKFADLCRRVEGVEARRVVQTGVAIPRELPSLLRVIAERVELLERRLPGREPFPSGDVLQRMEAIERQWTGLAGIFPSEAGSEQRQRSDMLTDLDARVTALEQQLVSRTDNNTDARIPDPAGFVVRREALEAAAIAAGVHSETVDEQRAGNGNSLGQRIEALERALLQEQEQIREGLVRIEALEARRDPVSLRPNNTQRMAHGAALRAAIADILQSDAGVTGPRVIEALRASHAGKLPSLRTVRWHLAALRGNGNTPADTRELVIQTLEN